MRVVLATFAIAASAWAQSGCVITTIAGTNIAPNADGSPAVLASVGGPVAADASGVVYIGAQTAIYKIVNSLLYKVAGTDNAPIQDGPALQTGIRYIEGIAVDSNGNIYYTDSNLVRKVTPNGTVATIAGTGAIGFSGDGGPGTAARLANPSGVAIDIHGNVLIADSGNYRIRSISPGGTITTIAGIGGGNAAPGDGGQATAAQLSAVSEIAADGLGRLFLIDFEIRVITPDGIINSYPSGNTSGNYITAIGADTAGDLFLIDRSNSNIRKVAPDGTITTLVSGTANSYNLDLGTADPRGNLYYYSAGGLFLLNTAGQTSLIADGPSNTPADGLPATLVPIQSTAVTTGPGGIVYFFDGRSQAMRRITPDGILSTLLGPTPAGANVLVGGYGSIYDAKTDPQGNVYVSDTYYFEVRRITPTGTMTTIAGGGQMVAADGLTAISVHFGTSPHAIAVDSNSVVYIADPDSGVVWRVAADGILHQFAAPFQRPSALAVDASGNLYVGDLSAIWKVTVDGAASPILQTRAANLALDSGGFVYFSALVFSGNNASVMEWTGDGYVRTLAGGPQSGYAGDGGPPANALLVDVASLALDAAGNLYIADAQSVPSSANGRIRKISNAHTCPAGAIPEISSPASEGQFAPGSRYTITGINLGPLQPVQLQAGKDGKSPFTAQGTSVLVDRIPSPLLATSYGRVDFVVPYGATVGSVQAEFQGHLSVPVSFQVLPIALVPLPGIYNQDATLNTPQNPAAGGSVVALFVTGEGQLTPPQIDGLIASEPLPKPPGPLKVDINGVPAKISFAAAAPGEIGKLQINVRIPAGLSTGSATVNVFLGAATDSYPKYYSTGFTISLR